MDVGPWRKVLGTVQVPERNMSTDAVIAWVDGNDPEHRQRLHDHLRSIGARPSGTADPTRFNDAGELEYCVASLFRFAPWFRKVHIVTAGQTPKLLRKIEGSAFAKRIRLVDHAEIFRGHERHLPTFNARTISSALWRIEGVAEQFVYFNDDFVLLQPLQETDFFNGDRMVVRGHWRKQSRYSWSKRLGQLFSRRVAGSHMAQETSAALAGFEREYYYSYHNPYPMRRSTLERYFSRHPERLEANLSHRLRSPLQFRTECLALHLEIAQGTALLDNGLRTVQLKPHEQASWRVRHKLARADHDPSFAFACLQSIEKAPIEMQAQLFAWLGRRVGKLDTLIAESCLQPDQQD